MVNMILGIGTDLVNANRIEEILEKYSERFQNRLFTEAELSEAAKHKNPAPSLAKRFAAKEACAKALGTGFRDGLCFKHISVKNDEMGKPILTLTDAALNRLQQITPANHTAQLHLSLSDDLPHALAFVVISAEPI